jgi:hypothetical protein
MLTEAQVSVNQPNELQPAALTQLDLTARKPGILSIMLKI